MVRKKRLSQHQSGNKKQYSTETLNVFMTDMILNSIDKKEMMALVLLDLSKAFDSINHSFCLRNSVHLVFLMNQLTGFGAT